MQHSEFKAWQSMSDLGLMALTGGMVADFSSQDREDIGDAVIDLSSETESLTSNLSPKRARPAEGGSSFGGADDDDCDDVIKQEGTYESDKQRRLKLRRSLGRQVADAVVVQSYNTIQYILVAPGFFSSRRFIPSIWRR